MTLFLLDSTVHIQWGRRHAGVADWLAQAVAAGHALSTSAVSVAEVFSGTRESERATWHDYFSQVEVFPIGWAEAVLAGELRAGLRARGLQLSFADALIGATALTHRATLVTANVQDFRHLLIPLLHLDAPR